MLPAEVLQDYEQLLFEAEALLRFKSSNAGFADSLIAVQSEGGRLELWTFERKFSKQPGVGQA